LNIFQEYHTIFSFHLLFLVLWPGYRSRKGCEASTSFESQ
jgi:hypothetical protein